ncbi:proline-rich protein 36-like [Lates calcarifer]|uniref:Proline-rich protein 36-like n=1 Tax=Lates calcarifer TaxID=8187 RepID=A0AAJ7LRY7_LATCA|nr:proline-rich protein 36-like [Lates calcarifer]
MQQDTWTALLVPVPSRSIIPQVVLHRVPAAASQSTPPLTSLSPPASSSGSSPFSLSLPGCSFWPVEASGPPPQKIPRRDPQPPPEPVEARSTARGQITMQQDTWTALLVPVRSRSIIPQVVLHKVPAAAPSCSAPPLTSLSPPASSSGSSPFSLSLPGCSFWPVEASGPPPQKIPRRDPQPPPEPVEARSTARGQITMQQDTWTALLVPVRSRSIIPQVVLHKVPAAAPSCSAPPLTSLSPPASSSGSSPFSLSSPSSSSSALSSFWTCVEVSDHPLKLILRRDPQPPPEPTEAPPADASASPSGSSLSSLPSPFLLPLLSPLSSSSSSSSSPDQPEPPISCISFSLCSDFLRSWSRCLSPDKPEPPPEPAEAPPADASTSLSGSSLSSLPSPFLRPFLSPVSSSSSTSSPHQPEPPISCISFSLCSDFLCSWSRCSSPDKPKLAPEPSKVRPPGPPKPPSQRFEVRPPGPPEPTSPPGLFGNQPEPQWVRDVRSSMERREPYDSMGCKRTIEAEGKSPGKSEGLRRYYYTF